MESKLSGLSYYNTNTIQIERLEPHWEFYALRLSIKYLNIICIRTGSTLDIL